MTTENVQSLDPWPSKLQQCSSGCFAHNPASPSPRLDLLLSKGTFFQSVFSIVSRNTGGGGEGYGGLRLFGVILFLAFLLSRLF